MSLPTLEQIRVATPCHVSWDDMQGEGAVRFCSQCRLNVYNLSDMTRDDAEALVAKSEGRVCVRLYRRADGSVISRDCPVGRRALCRQVAALVGGVAAVLMVLATGIVASAAMVAQRGDGWGRFFKTIAPPSMPWEEEEVWMGDMCVEEVELLPPDAVGQSAEG